MINNELCQLCGIKLDGPPKFTEATDNLPLCPRCCKRVRQHMARCRRGKGMIVLDALIIQMSKKTPILLLPRRVSARKSTWIYWPERMGNTISTHTND